MDTLKAKICVRRDTTANWNANASVVPLNGEVIVYTDYATIEEGGVQKSVPGIKIGDGVKTVANLPFIDKAVDMSSKADKTDTVLNTTLSRGRKPYTPVGAASFAFGLDVEASAELAHAEGQGTAATDRAAHAEGVTTKATGGMSHAEGNNTIASGADSHAEGYGGTFTIDGTTYTSEAKGMADHTEGYQCLTASAQPGNHAEGYQTRATGGAAHAEGSGCVASGAHSHAEGYCTTASSVKAHAEGNLTTASGAISHAEGTNTQSSGPYSHAEGQLTVASGSMAHSEGLETRSSGAASHAEGVRSSNNTTFTIGSTTYYYGASGRASHSEGEDTAAAGTAAHAEGYASKAIANESHAEGSYTEALGAHSHAEGTYTIASGEYSHAEGCGGLYTIDGVTTESAARGPGDHVEGFRCETSNTGAGGKHAEGYQTHALNSAAHSEGYSTTASGSMSHAEGYITVASGMYSHAEGSYTTAAGENSHAEGYSTNAVGMYSHVSGVYNVSDSYVNWEEWTPNTHYYVGDRRKRTSTSNGVTTVAGYICKTENTDSSFKSGKWINQNNKMNYAEIVGGGTGTASRKNIRALDWDGNERITGDVYVGCNVDSTGGNKVATETFVTGKMGVANGIAELDENGLVPSSQLPAYVDDVLEYDAKDFSEWPEWVSGTSYAVGDRVKETTTDNNETTVRGYICKVANVSASILPEEWDEATKFPEEGETGKIYIALDTNVSYRWGGSVYVAIASDLALGETSSTAYRGDRGAAAYAHAVTNKGSAFASGLYKITTNSEGHVTAAVAVTKEDITAFGIPELDNNGKVPTSQLPSLLALGETSSTAYRGDRGKAAYDAAVVNVDSTPTASSSHLVTSGGVATALNGKADNTALLLQEENIPNTTQTVTYNSSGDISQVVHKDGSNNTVRTDVFTFGTGTITEVRTAANGAKLTIVTNTTTYATTVTYAAA